MKKKRKIEVNICSDILTYCIKGLEHIEANKYTFKDETYILVSHKAQSMMNVSLFFQCGDKTVTCVTSNVGRVQYDGFNGLYMSYTKEQQKELKALFQNFYYKQNTLVKRAKAREKKIETRKCLHCGKEFRTAISNKKFCSEECCHKHYSELKKAQTVPHKHTCPICNKEFTSLKYQVYCSAKCRIKRNNNILLQKLKEAHRVTKVCKVCGKLFETNRGTQQIYCSSECAYKGSAILRRLRTTKTIRCKNCGEKFKAMKGRMFCSVTCAKDYYLKQVATAEQELKREFDLMNLASK